MNLLWLFTLFLAVAPGIAMLWYIRRLDRYEPEPWSTTGLAFLAGCISTMPALILQMLVGKSALGGFMATVVDSFILAALIEEVCKGGVAYLIVGRNANFNEPMDGIVYFGVAHMGFAVLENLLYIFSGGTLTSAIATAFARMTTAVPLHVVVGMIMGYHVGMGRYAKSAGEKLKHWASALFLPILLHGVYDVAAFNQMQVTDLSSLIRNGFGTALLYAAVVALWLFLIPRVRRAQEASPWNTHVPDSLPLAAAACDACGQRYPMRANYCHQCGARVAFSAVGQ